MPAPQARYWLLTIPCSDFMPYLPSGVAYIKGQLEEGSNTGFRHWQVLVSFETKVTLSRVKTVFGESCHAEITRSRAANDYVFKEDSRVGHQFELGRLAVKRNSPEDWDSVLDAAKRGEFDKVPSDILIRCYGNLKKIHVDSLQPTEQEKQVSVFWGKTGSGKSRRAWQEAGLQAYPKDPMSKFWDGYRGQENVVIDEFRGAISISHILRWLDRYPTIVEVKGSSVVLACQRVWITSNISPEEWYPDLDDETKRALRRRFFQVVHFN